MNIRASGLAGLVVAFSLTVGVWASDGAQIVAFNPPTGQLQRGQEAQATVTIENTATTARRFWVGLSFAHEIAKTTEWPEGWYDIYPLQTASLSPSGQQTVTFTVPIHDSLQPGQYCAVASVWDSFDQVNYTMVNRFDSTLWHTDVPAWVSDADLGALSFVLSAYSTLPNDLPTQLEAIVDLLVQEPMRAQYAQGRKYLLLLPITPEVLSKNFTIAGVPVTIGGALLLDLADICVITPEASGDGYDKWVTCWVTASLGAVSVKSQSLFPFGIIQHDFSPVERGVADYRPTTLQYGRFSCPFFTITGLTWDFANWKLKGPRLVPGGSTGVELAVERGDLDLAMFEIKREILIDVLVTALATHNVTAAYVSTITYTKLIMDVLQNLDTGVFRRATLDDGDIVLQTGDWETGQKMEKRYGYDYNANYYVIDVPSHAKGVNIITRITEGNGEGTFHTRYGTRPDFLYHGGEYTYGRGIPGSISIADPPPGKLYIVAATQTAYEGIDIVATLSTEHFSLSVDASSDAVPLLVSPADNDGNSSGQPPFFRTYIVGTVVTITAPQTDSAGKPFRHWEHAGSTVPSRSISVTMDSTKTVRAVYGSGSDPSSQLLVCGSTSPGTYEATIAPGNSRWFDIPVQNAGYSSLQVNCAKSGTAAGWTRFDSTSFSLESQESKKHHVTIDVPSDASSGTYSVTITYNTVELRILIRVAGLGEPWEAQLATASVWIDGSSTSTQYAFDNQNYGSFDISGKYQTHAQTYCSMNRSQYLNAGTFTLHVQVMNLNAENIHDLNVKVNNEIVGTVNAEDVAKGSSGAFNINSVSWDKLTEGQNVVSFGLRQYNSSDETLRWRIYDTVTLTTNSTTNAWGASSSVSIPYNVWNAIDDGYLASARVYANVVAVSQAGRVALYNNGQEVDSFTVSSSGRKYWRVSKDELDEGDNVFAFKGDPANAPRVQLSDIEFVITLRDADPVLEITKELSRQQLQVGEQATVTLTVTNTREDSATGYDTILSDSLPSGCALVSGDLTKNIGNVRYEDVKTHTYTFQANQAGRYVLPAAKVDYENIHGDSMADQSSPVELTVMAGSLQVGATVTSPAASIGGTVEFAVTVTSLADSQPVSDATVQGIVQRDSGSGWETIATVPLGWSPEQNQFIGQSPEIASSGEYQAYVIAQKDLYQDGASQAVPFSITIVTYVLTTEVAGGQGERILTADGSRT